MKLDLFKAIVIIGIVLLTMGLYLINDSLTNTLAVNRQMLEDSKQQVKINKERHIEALYSTYKSNVDTCKEAASQAKKDESFVKENCIKPVNNSIVGQWLKEWGREDLLVTK